MKRLLAAGTFALLAAYFVPPSAAFATTVNDDIYSATPIGSLPFSTVLDAANATAAGDDPACAASGRTLWYTYTAQRSGPVDADPSASSLPWYTYVGVYTGSPGNLTQVACAQGESRSKSIARFQVTAGTTYYLMASVAYYNSSYNYSFAMEPPFWHDWVSVGGSYTLSLFPDCQIGIRRPSTQFSSVVMAIACTRPCSSIRLSLLPCCLTSNGWFPLIEIRLTKRTMWSMEISSTRTFWCVTIRSVE